MKIRFQFSLRKLNFKLYTLAIAGFVFSLITSSACSTLGLQVDQLNQKKNTLPRDIKFASENYNVTKESACVIAVNDETGNFLIGKEQITKAQLPEKITEAMTGKTPDNRIVYIEGAENVKFQTVFELFKSISKADVDKVELVVTKANNEKPGAAPYTLEVRLPSDEMAGNPIPMPRPNPLTLVVEVDKSKNLFLNNDPAGNLGETDSLMTKLLEIFKKRERYAVFREGTNEIEKTVFIKGSRSISYGDFTKTIDALEGAGAQPIIIQINDLKD